MSQSENITAINKESFEEIKNKEGIYLIDFWAEWCGPCKTMNPILENLSEQMPEIKFLSVNVDENQEMSQAFGISSIPTFYIIKMKGDGSFDINEDTITVMRGSAPALDFKMALEKAVEESK